MKKKILIIGAVPHPDDLCTYGGTTTLMQNFIDYCSEHHYAYKHIDTLKYRNKIVNLLHFATKFICGLFTSDVVMYNASRNGTFTLFYHTAPIAYLFGKKVVFRKFGGNFLKQLQECPVKKRLRMVGLLNKVSIIFFETKALISEAPKLFHHPERIKWFPNCRKPATASSHSDFRKRFVFISRLQEEKGVDHLMHVADTLPEGYTVHLYGPVIDKKYGETGYFNGRKVEYCGALKTGDVLDTLKKYDVLVIPSYWKAEGYPGIIVEAMSVGLPVIATRIGGISEMVANGVNGQLIEPHDEDALRKAILSFDKETYKLMADRAVEYFKESYNSDIVNEKIYRIMISL